MCQDLYTWSSELAIILALKPLIAIFRSDNAAFNMSWTGRIFQSGS